MTSKSFRLLVAGAVCLAFTCCLKDQNNIPPSPNQTAIDDAEKAFNATIFTQTSFPVTANYRASAPKTVEWENARITMLSVGQAVVVPLRFRDPLYVSSSAFPTRAFSLNDQAKLVVYKDKAAQYVFRVLTFVPDSNYTAGSGQFSGTLFDETWEGGSVTKPWTLGAQKKLNMAEAVQGDLTTVVTICITITGYNYSLDDPDEGYTWTETSCDSYDYQSTDAGASGGVGTVDLAGVYGSSGGGGVSILVGPPPPSSVITNVKNYFNCFVNAGDPQHTYTVTVCVDQPDPGTRTPWTWTDGGVNGSSDAGNAVNVGHTFLILTENNQGTITTRNVGFYPSGFVMPSPASAAESQGVLNNDQLHGYNVSLTINVSNLQFFGILNAVSLGNNPGYDYNINSYNCTTFAIDALNNNGIALPATKGTWLGGGGDDPGDLGQDIVGMTLQSGMTRSTTYSAHPNTGSCN